MDYKPYSPEWHRKKIPKKKQLDNFDDYVDVDIIREDIYDILHIANEAYEEYNRVNKLAESQVFLINHKQLLNEYLCVN